MNERKVWGFYIDLWWHQPLENCPRLRNVAPNVFQTETLTLTFNPTGAIVMTHKHAKGQRSLSLKLQWKRTNRHKWIDKGICITFVANCSVKIDSMVTISLLQCAESTEWDVPTICHWFSYLCFQFSHQSTTGLSRTLKRNFADVTLIDSFLVCSQPVLSNIHENPPTTVWVILFVTHKRIKKWTNSDK